MDISRQIKQHFVSLSSSLTSRIRVKVLLSLGRDKALSWYCCLSITTTQLPLSADNTSLSVSFSSSRVPAVILTKKFPSISKQRERRFSSCHELWVPTRNGTSDLRISCSDALPLSHRDTQVSEVYYEVHRTRVLHTTRISNIESVIFVNRIKKMVSLELWTSFCISLSSSKLTISLILFRTS